MQLVDFSQAKVLVVGDIMLDRYWSGNTGRISPEAPVPVVNIGGSQDRPGGAANVALNLAALGCQVTLMGLTGKDEASESLSEILSSVGIECFFLTYEDFDTITKLRVMSRNQQLIRLDFERSFEELDKTELVAAYKERLVEHSAVVLSDYAKGCLSEVSPLIEAAKSLNIPVIVDPKGQDFSKYAGATLLTPNMSEFELVAGHCVDEQSLVSKAQSLIGQYQLGSLLVTRSEKGMTLLEPEKAEFHLPAKAKEVYDVTGAGDTVIATLAGAFAAGSSLENACVLANAAASIVVGKVGTSTVSYNELATLMSSEQDIGRGVMTEEQLLMAVSEAKKRGETLVMTNGCFDILHAGHVSYLANARKLGHRLIVAVNTDASVTELKGPGRPVNDVERRMSVLAGLASVDWVVPFSEDTPERLISELLPNILVKGGDYAPEDIAGGKQVLANGGEVKVLNFEDGISTTHIIQKLTDK
ncbi:bifunctional D-glycero-beta-D-manno-heptose-7-phosphate kinase/D-glycero-beta-D-manno-heptose 1-phosphate adenylyltransferase HldE [Alteromonadaceae bacterium M269]|nr:bifunctional D-glycero-beta-D-manno-heptose-7-phosphate kinase/D-glycero-beta-D-manno-heptose 1-phosphate adenylyltransferase HldE [Alteromonadaceae bacterium M269]